MKSPPAKSRQKEVKRLYEPDLVEKMQDRDPYSLKFFLADKGSFLRKLENNVEGSSFTPSYIVILTM